DQIVQALKKAQLQLVICSPESVQRAWINYETGGASVNGTEIIPLCHSGMTPAQLPVPLCMAEGVRLTDPKDLQRLYTRLSAILDSDVPAVDFAAYSNGFAAIELEYAAQRKRDREAVEEPSSVSLVSNPHVLCVSSEQYRQLGMANQIELVLEAFPKQLRHDRVFTSRDLRSACEDRSHNRDIVHIVGYVCPRSGELYFSEIRLDTGSAVGPDDKVAPEALAALFKEAQTR